MIHRSMLILVGMLVTTPAWACSICGDAFVKRQTLREHHHDAKIVLHGTLKNPTPAADGLGGTTEFHITSVLKNQPEIPLPKVMLIPRYLPVIGDTPPDYLFFCTIMEGKLDPYHGVPARTVCANYLAEAAKLNTSAPEASLAFFFRHLESADPTVAADAFHEFAKAQDRHIARAAALYDRVKLREWIVSQSVPEERIGVYALLLGLCGNAADAEWLAALIEKTPRAERFAANLGGLVAGLAALDPDRGWAIVHKTFADPDASATDKLNLLGCVRYFQATRADTCRQRILQAYRCLLEQPDFADLAMDDLRRWEWWELTDLVLGKFGASDFDSPLMKRGIVRYALSCPEPAARQLIDRLRKTDPKLVSRVEESLKR